MSLRRSPIDSPPRIAAFASPTARHGAQLLDSIADHEATGRVGDFPFVEIVQHDRETQDRCECGSDGGWWRLVGGSKARIKQREGRSDKTVGEVVVCFDCATGRSHPPISSYVNPARTTWKMHMSFSKDQLDTARQNANRIQLISDVETISSMYPAPPLLSPPDFSLADLDAVRTTQNSMIDVINAFGHGLSSTSRRDAPAGEVQDFCRRALASGTPVVVPGIPDNQLEQWRWSKNKDERGAIWRETEAGALRLKAKCRHGRKRVESTNLTIEKALNLVNSNDGSSDKDVIQIADWPHDRKYLMSDVLPLSLPSYNSMAPDSDTMHILDGVMNLDSKMYKIEQPPETGPLFYCGTPGTMTAGHCDSSSAKNDYVMDMAPVGTPEGDKGALWVVFLRDDLDKVLAVLARRRKITLEDVICSHKILLERDDLLDLLKDGVKVLYHMQRLGESIIVPAGCYHVVYNFSANGKIAADYVSLAEVDAVAKVDRLRRTYYASSDEPEAGDIARLPVRVLRFLVDVDVDALLGVQGRNPMELLGE